MKNEKPGRKLSLLYEFVQNARNLLPPGWPLPVSLLVLFFGASAILVLIHTETYFKMNKLQVESELARQQLSEQYQLFLKEQEAGEQVRTLRHYLRNHLHTIEKMAASNDAGTIRQYVSDLQTARGAGRKRKRHRQCHAGCAGVGENARLRKERNPL